MGMLDGPSTRWYRDGDAGQPQPHRGHFAIGHGHNEGSELVPSPHGSKLSGAGPGACRCPHTALPHDRAHKPRRAALPARRAFPAPLQHAASSRLRHTAASTKSGGSHPPTARPGIRDVFIASLALG